ncbi:hypothetical protein LJK88_20290 [Paenibacillus sp. P26]|nr:hypothetical protein LJK88_20290 [Paenibacillus sp. P26]UUZ96023.1 hypothetical protein LJK87_17590 [Paenibacillus sp. P25]
MLAIHPIHRRLAEITLKAAKRGDYTAQELSEIMHILHANASLVYKLDGLKELSFLAHVIGDMEWQQELVAEIDKLEAKCL